jgi:hypothetical protein
MTYINAALRREVIERANNCCEYCLVHQEDWFFSHEVDHIIAEKHGGTTTSDNLCLSCYLCNGYKGSDIGSIDWQGSGKITSLFHPRQQQWTQHFSLNFEDAILKGLTPEGRVTIFLLKLNSDEQLVPRKQLIQIDRYPCYGA